MAIKNQAITVAYYAWDTSNNTPKTGDVANHTIKLVIDGTVTDPTNAPTEIDATYCKGLYKLTLTAAEMNCDFMTVCGVSSTSNVVIVPFSVCTQVAPDPALDVSLATHTYTVLDANSIGISDVLVEAKQNGVLIQSNRTNTSGIATFYLTAGTYDFYATKAGYSFNNPDSEVVS